MENIKIHSNKNTVHGVLAHSYAMYFFALLIGSIVDIFFKINIFSNPLWNVIGYIVLLVGSMLIIWAQHTSSKLNTTTVTVKTFQHGPYCFTRTPTNFGLFFVTIGFSIIINSLFMCLFSLIAFFVAKFIFLNEEEKILAKKYGTPYLEYKKIVKF